MYYCKDRNVSYYKYSLKSNVDFSQKVKNIDFWKISIDILSYIFSTLFLALFIIFGYLYLTKQSEIISNQIKYVLSIESEVYPTKYPRYMVKSQKTPLKREDIARIDKILTPCDDSRTMEGIEQSDYPNVSSDRVRTIIVKRGDTLYTLAEKAYGDASYYRLIFDANPKVLKSKKDLHIGQVLRIPF